MADAPEVHIGEKPSGANEQTMEPAARERIDTLVAKGTAYQDRYEFIDDAGSE